MARKKNIDELVRLFRRGECLHSLIGITHELDTQNEWAHGGGLVGRDTLVAVARKVREGKTIRLSQYSSVDAEPEDRYFKNKLGGLGQYYLGPLKELEVLDGDVRTGVRYTSEWGTTLARVYDRAVDGNAFFEIVRKDQVNLVDIRSLRSFCPCGLRKNHPERDTLVDLLFCRGQGDLKHEIGVERRNTLLLLLDFARRTGKMAGTPINPQLFLSGCYSQFLPDGSPWAVHSLLEKAAEGWCIYQRQELLAIAVQGMFWGGLAALLLEGGYVPDIKSYAIWFQRHFVSPSDPHFAGTSFAEITEVRKASQPLHSNWQSPDHELGLAEDLLEAQKQNDCSAVVSLSIKLLTSLIARQTSGSPYGRFEISDGFFEMYRINLASLQRFSGDTWTSLNGGEWVEWLAANWGIRTHLRVALRKLRHQTQDSFRIVPLDDGLHVREAPVAKWSSSRLTQALRFLYDLGALDAPTDIENGSYALTEFGADLLESELARC